MTRIDCIFCDGTIAIEGATLPAELHCDGCGVTVDVVDPMATVALPVLAEAA